MMFGVVLVGTYTSVFIASPILIYLGVGMARRAAEEAGPDQPPRAEKAAAVAPPAAAPAAGASPAGTPPAGTPPAPAKSPAAKPGSKAKSKAR
jgi:hypothetical protein